MWRKISSRKAGRAGLACPAIASVGVALALVVLTAVGGQALAADASASNQRPASSRSDHAAKGNPTERADGLVKEALFREVYGGNDDRSRLLSEARSIVPNFAPAMWASGEVQFNRQWVKIDDVPRLASNDTDLATYLGKRDKTPDTLSGQLALARWCRARGLEEQARAHFNQALIFDPDNREARAELGYKRVGNSWIAKRELDAMIDEAQRLSQSLNKWLPKAMLIRGGLAQRQGADFDGAQKLLADIKDSGAIPALEYTLSAVTEQCATMLVEKLAQWDDLPATQALVRQAVYSPWDNVRELAAKKLAPRPKEGYVPKLLNAMYTPLEARTVVVSENGRLVSHEVFAREGRNAWEVVMIDTTYQRDAKRWGNPSQAFADAMSKISENTAAKLMVAAMQSARTDELDRRIMAALATATAQTNFVRPEDWWTWWDDQNEIYYDPKPTWTDYSYQYRVLSDEPYGYIPPPAPPPTFSPGHSCFVGGTPVWTVTGPKAIEKLRVGDLVLSQDTESGQLVYKAVLRTTIRQLAEVFKVNTSGPTLQCTGGHLFWVAGEGWTKARNLHSGQTLHCATGTVQVSDTEPAQPQRTYNLVVADFDTYFVGPEKILTHDVTERRPTGSMVPGLAKQ
jgi:tetratricopeptide (TPR) repeat protein